MSESVDYKARYEHLCAVVGAVMSDIHDTAHLLDVTSKRMTSTSANCSAAARTLKHIEHTLIAEVRHE